MSKSLQLHSISLMMLLVCVMNPYYHCQAAPITNEVTKATVRPTSQNDEMTISDMMTSEEEAEVDEMFPDEMRDDLKLKLILKALAILKDFKGESVFEPVSRWLPAYDVMPDELKLKLILKAILLIKDRPLESVFAGHRIGQLKLTLILKALWIVEESKTDFSLAADRGDLKLALILKAIDVLEVYQGSYEDTVFFTKSKKQLKLALILKAITLLKRGNWPVDIGNFWPMGEEDEPEGSQSETTTQEQTPSTSEGATEEPESSTQATERTKTDGVTSTKETTQVTEATASTETTSATQERTTELVTIVEGATTNATYTVGVDVTRQRPDKDARSTEVTLTEKPTNTGTEETVKVDRLDIPTIKKLWPKQSFINDFKWLKWLPKFTHK